MHRVHRGLRREGGGAHGHLRQPRLRGHVYLCRGRSGRDHPRGHHHLQGLGPHGQQDGPEPVRSGQRRQGIRHRGHDQGGSGRLDRGLRLRPRHLLHLHRHHGGGHPGGRGPLCESRGRQRRSGHGHRPGRHGPRGLPGRGFRCRPHLLSGRHHLGGPRARLLQPDRRVQIPRQVSGLHGDGPHQRRGAAGGRGLPEGPGRDPRAPAAGLRLRHRGRDQIQHLQLGL